MSVYMSVCQKGGSHEGPFTPNESERENEKDQRTIERDQKENFKAQRIFLVVL